MIVARYPKKTEEQFLMSKISSSEQTKFLFHKTFHGIEIVAQSGSHNTGNRSSICEVSALLRGCSAPEVAYLSD
jgi:hypothetical protein